MAKFHGGLKRVAFYPSFQATLCSSTILRRHHTHPFFLYPDPTRRLCRNMRLKGKPCNYWITKVIGMRFFFPFFFFGKFRTHFELFDPYSHDIDLAYGAFLDKRFHKESLKLFLARKQYLIYNYSRIINIIMTYTHS